MLSKGYFGGRRPGSAHGRRTAANAAPAARSWGGEAAEADRIRRAATGSGSTCTRESQVQVAGCDRLPAPAPTAKGGGWEGLLDAQRALMEWPLRREARRHARGPGPSLAQIGIIARPCTRRTLEHFGATRSRSAGCGGHGSASLVSMVACSRLLDRSGRSGLSLAWSG